MENYRMVHSNEVMNVKQLASYLGCGESSIRRMIKENILEYYRIRKQILIQKGLCR